MGVGLGVGVGVGVGVGGWRYPSPASGRAGFPAGFRQRLGAMAWAFDPVNVYGVIEPARLVPRAPAPAPAPKKRARSPTPEPPAPPTPPPTPPPRPRTPDALDVLPEHLRGLAALLDGPADASDKAGSEFKRTPTPAGQPPPLLTPLPLATTTLPESYTRAPPLGGDDAPLDVVHAGVLREEGGLAGWTAARARTRTGAAQSSSEDSSLGSSSENWCCGSSL